MSDCKTNSSKEQDIRELPLTWMRKIITALFILDKDNDGIMGHEDLMQMADNIIKAGNLSGKAADELYEIYRDYCDSGTSKEIVASYSLTNQLLKLWKYKDSPETIDKWTTMYSRIFKVLCSDSGIVTFDNYMIFWNGMNLDKRFAKMQFDYLDTNSDGLLSQDDFVKGILDYGTNTDENTLNRFYGPLINY
ncbi:unnamed protein product [Owenia fusiformis]|uniref:Uncharacterized protein n=1 Tax=Owenia fusiformis TaxID=6347 RepID=A0A8J1UN94_OWEFU|nr:unnamed protein product [Owenia fusiformis]